MRGGRERGREMVGRRKWKRIKGFGEERRKERSWKDKNGDG